MNSTTKRISPAMAQARERVEIKRAIRKAGFSLLVNNEAPTSVLLGLRDLTCGF